MAVPHWRRYLALGIALILVIVAVRVVILIQHRHAATRSATPIVSPAVPSGPVTLYFGF